MNSSSVLILLQLELISESSLIFVSSSFSIAAIDVDVVVAGSIKGSMIVFGSVSKVELSLSSISVYFK
jgi:ethanolamine utilization microcompartment shell protein EutS